MIQRPASDLSVSPISTCLASLVTRWIGEPDLAGGRRRGSTTSPKPPRPTPNSRCSTASRSAPIRALGGSATHPGDQVDLATVQPLRDDLGP